MKRSNTLGSVRSILKKKASLPSLAEAGMTPSRSVKFTASTSQAVESLTPMPSQSAAYHFGEEEEPYFYKTSIDWSGKAEVIVDSPPQASRSNEAEQQMTFAQGGTYLDSFALDQISPLKAAQSSPGTPAATHVVQSQQFFESLQGAIPASQASMLASSLASSIGLPSAGQTDEWSNLFETSLPHQHGASSLTQSSSSNMEITNSLVLNETHRTVQGAIGEANESIVNHEEDMSGISFTTPGKTALHTIQASRSSNSLASFSTPGASPEKSAVVGAESHRSLNTKVNLLKRDGEKLCNEFGGLRSPEEQFSTPATFMRNKRRRSSVASPSKIAGLQYRPPPSPAVHTPVDKSVYFSPTQDLVQDQVVNEPTTPINAEKSVYASPLDYPNNSVDITDTYSSPSKPVTLSPTIYTQYTPSSPSKSSPFSPDSSLQDLLDLFSAQHSALSEDTAKHRSLVFSLLLQHQKDSLAKDKRLINLKKQVDLAQQGWQDAIDEAGRWEEEQAASPSVLEEAEQLRGENKDQGIRLEHANRSCKEALEQVEALAKEKVELLEHSQLEGIRLRAEVDRAVQDGRDQVIQIQGALRSAEEVSAEARSEVAGLQGQIATVCPSHFFWWISLNTLYSSQF